MTNQHLTSWKAIAAVFGRDVRTVQRWEKEEGLPVHRHLHNQRHSVWATREELEAWWTQRGAAMAAWGDSPAQGPDADSLPPPDAAAHPLGRALRVMLGATVVALAFTTSGSTGRATPAWIEAAVSPLGSLPAPSAFEVRALRDLNGDGADDLLLDSVEAGQTLIYFGPSTAAREHPDVRVSVSGAHPVHSAPVGDIDGDGLTDLAVSVLYEEPETYRATGPTYLLRGRRVWPAGIELPRDADTTLVASEGPDIRMGACLSADGMDLNGDGVHDMVLGAADFSPPGLRSAGGVFIVFGRADWPDRMNVVTAADVRVHGSYAGHGLSPQCGAGDFNADGITDLAVIAGDDTLWALRGGRGSTYLFEGRAAWPAVLDAERDARVRISGEEPTVWGLAPFLADVNGDGADDLVSSMSPRSTSAGSVAIVFGGRDVRSRVSGPEADVVIRGRTPRFGHTLAVTDIDGDGLADLLISDPAEGLMHVVAGRTRWPRRGKPVDFTAVPLGGAATRLSGGRLAAGDFDGDGGTDVALDINGDGFGLLRPALPLSVEIRPNASPNVLVPGGVVAVTVSSSSVPLSGLDLSSLRAGGVPPSHMAWSDGQSSLQLYFDVDRLRLRPNASRLAVVGRTRAGVPVVGADAVVTGAELSAAR